MVDVARIQTECLQPARTAVYAHYAQYLTPDGGMLTVRYQGPVEHVHTQVIQTYQKVDEGPTKLVETRLNLIGEINTEGDEEIIGHQARFYL